MIESLKLPVDYISKHERYKSNLNAAIDSEKRKTGLQILSDDAFKGCKKRALQGTVGELGALGFLRKLDCIPGAKFNKSRDFRMEISHDLKDDEYLYEIKSIYAGAYATFHSTDGKYSNKGIAGFDISSVIRHKSAHWILVMAIERCNDCFIVKPHLMVWLPKLDDFAKASKKPGAQGGYYFDHHDREVDGEFLVGQESIENYFKKLCTTDLQ